MYYWNYLELANTNEIITRQKVEEKYREIKEKLLTTYKSENPKLQSSTNLLNKAYEYCKNDINIAIRNKIVQYSEKPNSPLNVDKAEEIPAIITGRRKDIREIPALKDRRIVEKFLKLGMNFNQLVPPEQNDEEIYYDFADGKVLSSNNPKSKTTILLAKKKNTVRDGEFVIVKVGIYNIKDKNNKHIKQLTKYKIFIFDPNLTKNESISLYGDIDLDNFEEDKEYKELFYKAFEKAKAEKDSYIGSLEENRIIEDGVEKSAARQLDELELKAIRKEDTDRENR